MSRNEFICNCNIIHQEVVDKTLKKMPEGDLFNKLAEFFKILGDTTRARILYALDQNEMCVCDIASLMEVTQSAVSHQLRVLKGSKLVKSRRKGKTVYYSLADEHVISILSQGMEHILE